MGLTIEKAKELLPIMQAFAKGKTIQFKKNEDNEWTDLLDDGIILSPCYDYRIKPEPKYRPFSTAEECWKEMHLHDDFPWIKHVDGEYTQIKNIGKYRVKVECSAHVRSEYQFEEALNAFTFTDGTPFGIKEVQL